ncbi:hypothetical protein L596_029708 [Steinernema carpocapsae]|uniref:MD domain-containing protein n=1 Tax=Steinernema carpocapsae TaxID=34508 RepID=A0A4U5LQK8_STECR|nr:hypothetical protein L596_029708 [Steinernema carpocapsae]
MAAELQANTKPSTSSKRPIFSALEKVFRPAYITTRSQAFLITGGLPNDLPKFEATLDALSRKHIYVNTIIMGDTNLPGQAPYTDPSFEKLSELTYISGGGVYQMPSYDMLDTFLVTDVGTLFDNYYISSKLVKNCSSATEYIQVNSHSTLLTFDLFAKQAAVTIHDPLGAPHLAVKSAHTKTNALYLIQNKGNDNKTLVPGLWTVTVNNNVENPGACLINVRGVDKKYVYVAYSQDLMTDNGLHSDATSLAPKPLISNAVVVKSTFGTAQYVQIYGGQDRKLLFASPLVQRLRCQYQFISTESFWCARGLNFFVVIDGIDELGFPYRRQVVGHCIDTNVRLIEEA